MPLDSLGLGLTLDTTLLEKADKTLENMAKNSKLVMQNLTRGITAFNEGKIADFTQVLSHMSSALDKLSKTEVSPDFDTTGQDKFIDRMQHIMSMMEKMSKIKGAKFYDPTEVYATDKDVSDILAEMGELQEYKKKLAELVEITKDYDNIQRELKKTMYTLRGEIPAQQKEVDSLANSYDEAKKKQEVALKAMATQFKSFSTRKREKDPSLTDEQLMGKFAATASMQKYIEAVKKANEELAREEERLAEAKEKLETKQASLREAGEEYQSNWRVKQREEEIKSSYDLIKEQEKILQAEMEFAQATEAERAAMLTKKNEAEIKADQKRVRDKQKEYENLRKTIQKGEKDIADLEASRATFKEAGRSTKGIDAEIKKRRDELNALMKDELEFRSSQYWPKLQAIDEKFNSEAFVKNQKALAKLAAKESRKDVTSAIQYSRNAQTINEEKEAIKRLVEARDNLSTSTARYKKTVEDINKRILAHKDHIEAVTRVEKEQNTLADSVINRYRKQLKALDEVNKALEKQMKIERKTSVADLDKGNADTQALLARQKTIADDIADIESRSQGELDVIKEQHEAERAKKRIDETLRQNEREKQEYAKLLDEKYALEKQKKAMEDAGAKSGDKAYDNILQQEQDLNNQISQLKAKHQKDLDEIDKKHAKKRNDDDVKAFIDAQKEKQRIAEEYAKKQREKTKKYGTISSASADRLIGVTENAKNINQHKAAIEKLTQAKASLDNTDKNYFVTLKKIDKALKEHHKALRDAGVESNNLMQSHRGLLNIGGQLARRLALAFSVSQLTQYFRKLVEVRGQFEKTEVALTSIIGDNQKAQKLMNQTIALAIKSPFTLQQLTGYTKQLAAYQVSYEELHSTTKMLADVSAGLGVEMDRLILAFGQVKAANYLRATEVRQFTEAGFNILGELAKYYGELEDRMISVGEVQEMVTKRMVNFEDVAEVFKRVTQEGGMFYEMQSKQAETLAGQWTNLKDRIDVMLNEIGTDREGLLKGLVRMLASLIDNWEAIADVLKIVVGAFVLYKMNLLAVTKSQIANNLATQESIRLKIKEALATKSLAPIYKNLSSSMKGFGSAMKSFGKANLWLAALTAVIGSIVAITKHVKQMNEALAEQDKVFNENTSSLLKLSEQYKKVSKEADSYNKKIKVLQELSDKLEDRNLTLSVKIEDVDENNIDKIFEENSERLQKAYEFGKDLGKAIAQGMNEAQGNVFGFSFFGENLKEDAEDYGQSMGKLMSWGMQVQMKNIENAAKVNYDKMGKYAQEYYDSIKRGKRANESEYEWTKRRATALVMISKLEGDIVGKNKELQKTLRNVVADGLELHHETKGIYDNLVESAGGLKNLRKEVASNPIEMAAQIKTEVDKLDYDPATKQFIINDLYAMLHLKVNYVEDPNAQSPYQWDGFKKDLKESRDDLKKFVDENNKSLGYENFFFSEDEIKKLEEFSDALEAIQKLYDENNKTIAQLDGTSDAYSKAEKTRLEALQSELKEVAAKWNYDLDAKNKKGDNDALKRLKDQIKLIKDANKAYEERNKKFGKEESQAVVSDSYKDAFKKVELAIEDIDYTNLEGVVKALEDLEDEAKKAGGEVELLKAISEVKAEIGLTLKERQDKELLDQVQELFDQYDLSLELKKLNIPPDLAKSLFDVDYLDLEGLKKAVEDRSAEFIGTDMEDEYKKFLEKINDLSRKQREDEAKEFINFLKKNLNEIQVIQDKGAYNIALADRLFGEGKITAEQYMSSIRQIVEDTNKEVTKVNLDKFKDSTTYIKAMGNLAAYSRDELESMINALQGQVGANAGNMGADEIRAYYEALERLVDQYDKIESPFQKGEINDLIEYLDLQKELNKEKEKEAALEQRKAEINNRLNLLQAQLKSQQERGDVLGAASTQRQIKSAVGELKKVDGELVSVTSNISVISEKVANLGDGMIKSLVVAQKVVNEIANIANASTKMFDDIKSAADALGADTESGGWAKAGYAMEMVGGVSSELTSGLASLASGDFAGALASVVGMVTKLISGFAKIHDQDYQDIIEEQAEKVERLGKAYEKLEKSTERAYSIEQLQKANTELERNVELQIASYKAMIAAEQAKKNTDTEQIAAWNEELEALTQQWEELKQSLVEGVGGVTDYRSQTREFVDSWVSAFKETGDGLSGLKENFREFFDNIIAEQASLRVTEKFLAPFYESLNTALGDLKLSVGESKNLREEADKIMPELSKALELIWNELGGSRGEVGGDGLSGLQKGIQGITEDTAQIIEAYLNSIRAYTSEQVEYTKKIYNMFYAMTTGNANGLNVRLIP